MKKLHALFTTLFAATSVFAADILEIRPCDEFGNSVSWPSTTKDDPYGSGKDLYFNVRLVSREENRTILTEADRSKYSVDYYGTGSEKLDFYSKPLKIGIVVSGKTKWASYAGCQRTPSSTPGVNMMNLCDLIFTYHTEPGDLALPIKLAVDDKGTPADESDTKPTYIFRNDNIWKVNYHSQAGLVDGASFEFNDNPTVDLSDYPDSEVLRGNYSLKQCGFHVQTVDFKDYSEEQKWETATAWRTVQQGSTVYGELQVSAPVTNEVTLYVWSQDESVVVPYDPQGKTVSTVSMKVPDAAGKPVAKDVQVAKVTIQGGQSVGKFTFKGVTKGATTNLVLSGFNHYNWNGTGSGDLIKDYVTAPVTCTEPPPPYVEFTLNGTDRKALVPYGDGYQQSVAQFDLSLSTAYTNADGVVKVTVAPVPTVDAIRTNEFIRLSDGLDGAAWSRYDGPIELTFMTKSVGATALKQPVYVFALGGSRDTSGGASGSDVNKSIRFKVVSVRDSSGKDITDYYGTLKDNEYLFLKPQAPQIVEPASGATISAVGGVARKLTFKIDDSYYNCNDNKTGYEIWWINKTGDDEKQLGSRWALANGVLCQLNADGTIDETVLPTVTYNVAGDYAAQFRVVGPNGEPGPGPTIREYRDVTVRVSDPATVSITLENEAGEINPKNYNEGASATVSVTLSKAYDQDLWAFLKPNDASLVSGDCLASLDYSLGIYIMGGQTSSEDDYGEIVFEDGAAKGTTVSFDVVLCTTDYYDPVTVVDSFKSKKTSVKVLNVKPTLKNVYMNVVNKLVQRDGAWWMSGSASLGVTKSFTFEVEDPAVVADLRVDKADKDAFQLKYTIEENVEAEGGGVATAGAILKGDPNDASTNHVFTVAGRAKVTIQLMDKDMKNATTGGGFGDPFEFYVNVTDNPRVYVDSELGHAFAENAVGVRDGKLTLHLSENPATIPLEVELTVTSAGKSDNPGKLILGGCEPVSGKIGVYTLTVGKGLKEVNFFIDEADGTANSATKGFYIVPKVTTASTNPEGTEWRNYFSSDEGEPFLIENVAPIIYTSLASLGTLQGNCGSQNGTTNAYTVGIGDADPITWSVTDVLADLGVAGSTATNITVKWTSEGNTKTYYVTDEKDYQFTPKFTSSGIQKVTVTVTDKDNKAGGMTTADWYYKVTASKQLKTYAHGPAGSAGTKESNRYANGAKGLGEGRTYSSATFGSADSWVITWNCGTRADVTCYAFGYKVGDEDDGTLKPTGKDVKLDPNGNHDPNAAPTSFYEYPDKKLDSFFYRWLPVAVSDDAGELSAFLSIAPEKPLSGTGSLALPLPADQDGNGNYKSSGVEAVFSKEYLASDNMGDINGDGIPDVYVGAYGFGVVDMDDGSITGNDLASVAAYNEDGDYLPANFTADAAAFVPGGSNTWLKTGLPFLAKYEIRGFYDADTGCSAFNDATTIAGIRGVKPDVHYADPATDATSTLSALEWDAYVQAGQPGEDKWSPERPTDPTKADTDEDGLPDGYEYYIWYKATVGWFDNDGKHQYLTGRRYNPRNPFAPTEISPAELAAKFDPLKDGSINWDKEDTDNDGLVDRVEFMLGTNPWDYDSDGDGLPDGYEVNFTKTDPLKYATDDQHCDADLNEYGPNLGQGDAMAEYEMPMNTVGVLANDGSVEWYGCDETTNFFTSVTQAVNTATLIGLYTTNNENVVSTNLYLTTKTVVTLNGVLIGDYGRDTTWTARYDDEGRLLCGNPIKLSRGMAVSEVKPDQTYFAEEVEFPPTYYVLWQYTKAGALARGRMTTDKPTLKSVCAKVARRTVKVQHYYVRMTRPFDPRTGWKDNGGQIDSRTFTHLDEFLTMTFFYRAGGLTEDEMTPSANRSLVQIWRDATPSPTDCDTDGDNMPDGWELYLMGGTVDQPGNGPGPGHIYSPIYPFSKVAGKARDPDADLIDWMAEYSGTQSSAYYSKLGCESIFQLNTFWRNKAMPTDPWDSDTDGDGIIDGYEGGFVDSAVPYGYGRVIRDNLKFNESGMAGGCCNPLTWDTDGDGLPDPWEVEYCGTYTQGPTKSAGTNSAEMVSTGCTWNMDGMNATVGDARIDYDHDGLANWQEYMVGAMRCWRYDDPESTWVAQHASMRDIEWIFGPDPTTEQWNKFWHDRLLDRENVNGEFNPNFANGFFDAGSAYFSCCDKAFDSCCGRFYMLRDGVHHDQATTMRWAAKLATIGIGMAYPVHYISCDPRMSDTDCDGMDDYYELFHGLNPLLGEPAVTQHGTATAYDVVCDAYLHPFDSPRLNASTSGFSALVNWWRNPNAAHETVPGSGIKHEEVGAYDFIAHPWLNGMASADPDGDNIGNQEEAIMPNVQAVSTYHHTDPTPLWMTDSSYTNSLTRRYYRVDAPKGFVDMSSWFQSVTKPLTFEWEGVVYTLTDFPGFTYDPLTQILTFSYDLNRWGVYNGWEFSFEENEGYDSDHDYLSDFEEAQGKTKNASDPQDHDDPYRRQAMYFGGDANKSFLQTPVATYECCPDYPDASSEARQNFLYYTVECWAKPDGDTMGEGGRLQTLVERAIWADNAGPADERLLRKNFLIGINNGRWYTRFDSTGTDDKQYVEISDGPQATTNWTHVAATYDGTALRLYVNGVCNNTHQTRIQPEHGVNAVALNASGEMNPSGGTTETVRDEDGSQFISILVGASAVTQKGIVYDWTWRYRNGDYNTAGNPEGLAPEATTLADYGNFYKGYIDEVRIWDGARSAADILSDCENRVRYTTALVEENRTAVYAQWKQGALRSAASSVQLPPQLMYHWAFDHIPGAVMAGDVIQVPAGFNTAKTVTDAKARWVRPADWVVRNWNAVDPKLRSTVYDDNAWVPWINNTVAHLRRYDLTTLDSVYWSEDYAGDKTAADYGYASFKFPRTHEVPSRWTQQQYNSTEFYDLYLDRDFALWNGNNTVPALSRSYTQRSRWDVIAGHGSTAVPSGAVSNQTELAHAFRFALRDRNTVGDDLLPMGGAYPRRISTAEGGMWDNRSGSAASASDAWAQTGKDSDNNGLPDWWEEYARANYCKGLSPRQPIAWDTTVKYRTGLTMTAWQAYLRDLAAGLVKIGSKITYKPEYADTRDNDNDGLPDWWEELYGLDTSVDNADDDPDNDGLSNYQEYLLGEYYLTNLKDQFAAAGIDIKGVRLNPMLASSADGQRVTDYFLRYSALPGEVKTGATSHFFANEYFGAIANDHDFMEDWWENLYSINYTSAKKYDPSADKDGDGWSTWAECRASLWGAYFSASLMDQWTGSTTEQYVPCYPQPVIGVRPTYYGKQDISGKQLVVRTTSGQTARTDATFVVPTSVDSQTRYIGPFVADRVLHGHMSPGMLNADSIVFQRALTGADRTYYWNWYWYSEDMQKRMPKSGTFETYLYWYGRYPHIELEGAELTWEGFCQTVSTGDSTKADLYIGSVKFGYVDCTTGEYELDMTKFSGEKEYSQYVFRVTYTSRLGEKWPQTVYLSDTKELATGTDAAGVGNGYVREGKNTIEAFIDLDANGAYTAGEPYGVVQDVNVGWHKVPVTVIELKDTSHVVPRFDVTTSTDDRSVIDGTSGSGTQAVGQASDTGTSGITKKITIRRTKINGSAGSSTGSGDSSGVLSRTLVTKTLVMDSRSYMTEADVLDNAKFDLDSRWLVRDAQEKLGIKRSAITEATYAIYEVQTLANGTTTNNLLKTFVNTFNPQRTKPSAVAPVSKAPVYAASPTFAFSSGDETMTAYRLQIAKTDGTLVYDSGDGEKGYNLQPLPGRVPNTAGAAVYEITPPVYVGERACAGMVTNVVLTDSTEYKWRVALFNAKFNVIESEADWSDWAAFQMDVTNRNRYPYQATGYGTASAAVRYYGPTNAAAANVWVEAFESADFRCQPAARVTLGTVAQLADYGDLTTTNAVLRGIAPGTWYFRAFIDFNGNGQRDDWESWGYLNNVGQGVKAIYNPKPFVVTASTADWVVNATADFTIYIEDCDTDQNEIPDCMEAGFYGETDVTAADGDGDGIADSEEESYSTNPQLADTDNDGMPDGWEAKFADTDPTLSDAGEAIAGDVMAFAKVDATFITVTNGGERITYVLADGQKAPKRGNPATGLSVWTTYTYPMYENGALVEYVGLGTNLTLVTTSNVATEPVVGTVVLVHDQVYAKFGFNAQTAVPVADAVNTKTFTALDKYLVVRYLEATGRANEANVNRNNLWKSYTLKPYEVDYDGDGIPDGWELYVGANPWKFDDRASDIDGDGVTLLDEFNGGYALDPKNANTLYRDIGDRDVVAYRLHSAESQLADDDNDGLSNWAEYLASKKTGKTFKVDDPCSVAPNVLDYFVKTADGLYVGESLDADGLSLIADHDFMEDDWEDLWDESDVFPYSKYANRYVYDANLDADEDGWKNWSECRAYHWGCGFYSDIIDTFITGDVDSQLRCYPQPAIGLHVTYNGSKDPSWKSLIVRTQTANSTYPDAIFQIDSMKKASAGGTISVGTNATTTVGGMEKTQILGVYSGMPVMRGFLNPGLVVPSSAKFEITSVSQELMYYWHCTECNRGSGLYAEYKDDISEHGEAKTDPNNKGVTLDTTKPSEGWVTFATSGGGNDGRHGEIYYAGDGGDRLANVAVGTIDFRTGEYSLDLGVISEICGCSFEGKAFRAVFTYNLGAYWPQTVWLSAPEKGYVKEGANTIEAFLDLNEDGRYDVGEPYGLVQNVNIGWQKTPEFRIELKDGTYSGIPLFEIEAGLARDQGDKYDMEQSTIETQQITDGEIHPAKVAVDKAKVSILGTNILEEIGVDGGILAKFEVYPDETGKGILRIVRTGINGATLRVNRTVYAKNVDVTYGKVFTVAELIQKGQIDLDAKYLAADAVAAGIPAEEIQTVEYTVYWGVGDALPLYAFTRTFDRNPIAPELGMTYENSYYKMLTAQPELSWHGREGYGAFAVQVSENADFSTILYAATNVLPQADTTGCYTFKPDLYVGEGLKDQTTYYWRVAQLNAKFTENVWSKVGSFETAVESKNANTGYGKLAAEVRYYGASDADVTNVVVGVYEAGDFCCAPVARQRLSGTGKVTSLVNESGRAFTTISANVTFDGIAPGEYYVMAFVDTNGNGKRDAYETWGYACKIATAEKDIWSPVATTVVSVKANVPQVLVVMEDTDVNQNMTPDCLEDMTEWGGGESYTVSTDDSDGDGIPDDYEEKMGLDPYDPTDANIELDGDVMAYQDIANALLVQIGTSDANSAWYVVMDPLGEGVKLSDSDIPLQTPAKTINSLATTWQMGDNVGLGRSVTFAGDEKVLGTKSATVRLVHAQVYAMNGFKQLTANAQAYAAGTAVNTKPFTVLDKYLVCRYLENIGVGGIDEATMIAEVAAAAKAGRDTAAVWRKHTLDPNALDGDHDGIDDGWELYTMFGVNGLKAFVGASFATFDEAKISPWKTTDGLAVAPGANARLKLVEEFDGGYFPTDPWNIDTDNDNVIDKYAYEYHLKGGDSGEDFDGDGLSNYAEYLISEVFQFAKLDPDNPKTDMSCVDYFRKAGDLYFGEIFTDHDQVNDVWEQDNAAYANRDVYDPARDADSDGWSNWAEAKAGTHPGAEVSIGVDGEQLAEYPIPAIAAKVVYRSFHGKAALTGNLVFQAWSQKTDPDMTGVPDATWTASSELASTNVTKYVGVNPGTVTSYCLGTGQVKPGSLRVWFRDAAAENALFKNGVEVSTSRGTNPKWYYFVEDVITGNSNGDLMLCATNVTPVKVGSIDYTTGMATIDFGCDALQGVVYDSWVNGTGGTTDDKSTGIPSTCVKIDLSRSFVKLAWMPVNVDTTGNATYYLSDAAGHVREGLNKFVVFCDADADGKYTAGEPFGFVQNVDVGWQGGAFAVELTETSPVFARVDLSAGTSDREYWQSDVSTIWDISGSQYKNLHEQLKVAVSNSIAATGKIRVRVARALVDHKSELYEDAGVMRTVPKTVVMDKYIDLSARSYIHEGDFVSGDSLDLDWNFLSENKDITFYRALHYPIAMTNVSYMIVLGEGDFGFGGELNGSNTIYRCLVDHVYDFDMSTVVPTIDKTEPGMVYGACPTFEWAMQDPDGGVYNSYTAFKLQIRSGSAVVYDSGFRVAPPRGVDGRYSWTLDEPIGTFVKTSGNYSWRVAMYNAKFKDEDWNWSEDGSLVVNLNNQQEMNDHGYSSIAAAVKYVGPTCVLEKMDKNGTKGVIRLEAFTTADFAGAPAGATIVTGKEGVMDTALMTANAEVCGLPQNGTYYLRAYIDLNGNGTKDDFESWGAASEPVTLAKDVLTIPTVGIYIEDADTDGDWIPDAYEYAKAGWSGDWSTVKTKLNGYVEGYDSILFSATVDTAGISTGLSGASLTIFQDTQAFIVTLLGMDVDEVKSISYDIRKAVEKKVNPNTVKITAMALAPDGKSVTLSVAAEVTDSVAGQLLGKVYDLTDYTSETALVKIHVYKKATLAANDWVKIGTFSANVGKDDAEVVVPVTGVDMKSGFYKIEIEQ